MSELFTINATQKVIGAKRPLEDGEYRCTIKELKQPATSNPYFVFTTTDDREIRYFINSQKTLDIVVENINRQLSRFDTEEVDFLTWIDSVVGESVTVWLLTSTASNGADYQNPSLYKPAGFDSAINGAI